jgi:hypothetical protein
MSDLSPNLTAALIAAIVGVIAGFVSAYYASRGAEKRLKENYEREISVERMARQVFLNRRGKTVPLTVLQALLGGIRGDELRKALVGAGALRFRASDGSEEWGLISRNKNRINRADALYMSEDTSADKDDVGLPEATKKPAPVAKQSSDLSPEHSAELNESDEFESSHHHEPEDQDWEDDRFEDDDFVPSKVARRGKTLNVNLRRGASGKKGSGSGKLIGDLDR